ncbi:MAG: polysaccharide deacetylase family protein [Flavobacteriales bacterium]
MILIYVHKLTPRIKYIFKTIFTDVLQVNISFTSDCKEFENHEGVKINYSDSKLSSGIFFQATTLLFETKIQKQDIIISEYENKPCFYSVDNESILPFDPFAASFYLISRYEEYLPHKKDEHRRFLANESLAFQHDFLEEPLVNLWTTKITRLITLNYPEFDIPPREYQYISTLDIDNAYAYQHKGIIRTLGALGKSFIKGSDFSSRLKVIFGNEKDPFDTFKYQKEVHKKYNITPIYFFLLGDYGVNDKNISVKNKTFQRLIQSISENNKIGIHPSYASNKNPEKIATEKNRLQKVSKQEIMSSRQHYLKLNLPNTYQNLITNGIIEDYTMGYAEQPGFRASICSAFYFYDLEKERETELKIFPFTVMEATFQYYKKSAPEKALKDIIALMQKVKDVDGTFISVWHNESLSDEGIWKGWKIIYEKMLKESINKI